MEKAAVKMITWEPAIYVRGVGAIKLTIEQVRDLIKQAANGQQTKKAAPPEGSAAKSWGGSGTTRPERD